MVRTTCAKTGLMVAVIALVAVGATALTGRHFLSRECSQTLIHHADAVARELSQELEQSLQLGTPIDELAGFNQRCQGVVDRSDTIAYALVVDRSGTVLYRSRPAEHSVGIESPEPAQRCEDGSAVGQRVGAGREGFCGAMTPIRDRSSGQRIGEVRVGFTPGLVARKANRLLGYSLIAGLIVLGLGLTLLAFTMPIWVTRPLSRLFGTIGEERGGSKEPVEVTCTDEGGQHRTAQASDDSYAPELAAQNQNPIDAGADVKNRIPRRQQMDEAPYESNRFHAGVLDAIQDGLNVLDRDLNVLRVNACIEERYAERAPLVGRKCYEVFQARSTPCPGCPSLRALECGQTQTAIVPYPSQEQPLGWMELSSYLLKDEAGNVIGVIEYSKDITDRKLAEQALSTSERKLSSAVKMARLGYWELDLKTMLFTFDDHFYSIFRTTAEEVGGYTMTPEEYGRRFLFPEDAPMLADETAKAIATTDPNFTRQLEHRIRYADGETGYIAVRFSIQKDEQGRTIKTYGANQDITERRKAEEALADRQETR